ncbi:MAG: retropepsin-like aspartic protease [Ideonella sp.]
MNELSRGFKIVTVWLLLGLGLFLGIQWWHSRQDQARFQANGASIEIRRGPDGHYHWPGTINGRRVDFLIDTGATGTAMSAAMAAELALSSLGTVRSVTAGGVVTGNVVAADVELQGGVTAQRLRVVALPGLGERPLLGMDVLGRLNWRQEQGILKIDARSSGASD